MHCRRRLELAFLIEQEQIEQIRVFSFLTTLKFLVDTNYIRILYHLITIFGENENDLLLDPIPNS